MTTVDPTSRATALGMTRARIPAAAPYAIHSRNPMSKIMKYPTDTWREDCSRSMRRICSTGAMPISTAHDDAVAARMVVAMALLW